ncbi:MAG TPA: SagB family peptide dehydrogenase [Planctomycetaceae bacterium]
MVAALWISWQDDVSLLASEGRAVVAGRGMRVELRRLTPDVLAALERLAPPGEDEERLAESILAGGNVDSLARWHYHVNHLRQRGLIRRSLYADGKRLATVSPLCRMYPPSSRPVSDSGLLADKGHRPPGNGSIDSHSAATAAYVLSRFAYLRREGDKLVLESPLAHARVVFDDPRVMPILGALAAPTTFSKLVERVDDLAPADLQALLSLLQEVKLVDEVAADAPPSQCSAASGNDSARDVWEFHDLLFHSRSRGGRSDGRFGGTYRFANRPPPPAMKSISHREAHELYRPDIEQLERDDPPLARVQNHRRSIRSYGAQPITARQLGEFLYRVGRVNKRWRDEAHAPSGPVSMEFTSRPYPAGGGLYELEFYAVVRSCQDLEPGLYHYDPELHQLARISRMTGECDSLLNDAASSAGIAANTLQVLIILTARFERIAWKYESIAYSLVLKDVGVVLQTMYLAATAMNLAPCALGCGDSDLFARAAETDYFVETSVGEFLLGSVDVPT